MALLVCERNRGGMSGRVRNIFIWSGVTILLLFIVLVVHIIIVTKPGDEFHAQLQLARIDFPDTLSDVQREEAVAAIKKIEGVTLAKVNASGTNLVYSVPTGTLDAAKNFEVFDANIDFRATPFIAPAMENVKGCPVLDKESLAYRFSTFIKNTFH